MRGRLGPHQPATAGIDHRIGLFANLLDHVVGVAPQFDSVRLPVDAIDSRRDRTVLQMPDLEITCGEPDQLAILQECDPRRVRRDGHRIAGQQVLSLAESHDHRASKAGADDLPRTLRADGGQPVGPLEPWQGAPQRREQVVARFQLARDQVSDDFGVGLTVENESQRCQLAAQRGVILDHAVVDDGHGGRIATAADVRMGIAVRRRSMSRPPRMADPAGSRSALALERFLQHPDPPCPLPHQKVVPLQDRHARAVISAILEPPQPRHQDRRCLMRPGVSHNPAHRSIPSCGQTPIGPARGRAQPIEHDLA